MKLLDFENCRKIGKEIPMGEYYDWVDDALVHKDEFFMPVKTRMPQENGNYYAVMPVMYDKTNVAAVKMIGRHTLKEGEKRSIMMSDMLMYEGDTGVLKAVMDAEYVTTLRTGACAAHSAILYGKKNFKTVGLFGLGNIMTVCIEVLLANLDDRELVFKLYKHNGHEIRFMERFKDRANVSFVLCDTYEETIKDSDVIISAVTRVAENFASDDCYAPGCTVIPIMTLGFQNCDLSFDKVFTDEKDQIRGFKYFNQFKSVANTTDVLNKKCAGRENDEEKILVYNYGLAILDLYFAEKYLERADDLIKEVDYNYSADKFFID